MRKHGIYVLIVYLALCLSLRNLGAQTDKEGSINDDKYSFIIGLSVGYLPLHYLDYVPNSGGAYEDNKIINEIYIQVPISIQYKNRYEIEARHFSILQFGHYHSFENFTINTIGFGVNPLSFLKRKYSHSLFMKLNFGISNFCVCGDDVPFKEPNLSWMGMQLHYRRIIKNNIYFSIGVENSGILSKIENKYNATSWTAGVAFRLF